MSFTTYAQNFEDVLLWRALRHVTPGFYVDVGANDPVEHSVTKAFYDAGWRGINIEPLPAFHEAFVQQRPEDINLAVAAGASEGEIVLFDVPAVNGWASSAPEVAAAHQADGYELVELKVPLRTLDGIFREHVKGDIHFLKIDVEGFEREVLLGLDLGEWRPWIVVVEATMPNSRETNHETWEALVTGHDYRFAYFDGLNRYYVAVEHQDLMPHLAVQANVFDDFLPSHLENAWQDNAALRASVEASAARLAAVQQQLGAELAARQEQLDAAHARHVRDAEAWKAAVVHGENIEAQLRALHAGSELQAVQLQAAVTRNAELEMQLRAAAARIEEFEALQRVATARRMEQEALLGAAAARCEELEARLGTAAAKSEEFEARLRTSGARNNEQEVLLRAAVVRADALEAQMRSVSGEREALDAQLQAQVARNGELETQLHATAAWGNELDAQLQKTAAWGNELDAQLRAANAWGNGLAHNLQVIHRSMSWRVSKPVRMVGNMYRRLTGVPPLAQIDRTNAVSLFKRTTLQRLRTVARSAPVRKYVVPPLLRIPGVEQRLMRLAVTLRENATVIIDQTPVPPSMSDLSPRARTALSDLERARHRSSNP